MVAYAAQQQTSEHAMIKFMAAHKKYADEFMINTI